MPSRYRSDKKGSTIDKGTMKVGTSAIGDAVMIAVEGFVWKVCIGPT